MKTTVSRGLIQLKRLDDRINKGISNIEKFVISNKKKENSVLNGTYTKNDYIEKIKSEWQSLNDLMELRKEIKSAIVISNATTKVVVAGKEYTVADAIERKNSILKYENNIIKKMNEVYNLVLTATDLKNKLVEENACNLFGQQINNKKDEVNRVKMINTYVDLNKWELVDPINLKELKETLNKEVQDFLSEIDSVLTESNAITIIDISRNPSEVS